MATKKVVKKKEKDIQLYDGMYFSAKLGSGKSARSIRGVIYEESSVCDTIVYRLCGANLEEHTSGVDDARGFPSYIDVEIPEELDSCSDDYSGPTVVEILKSYCDITDFVELKDRRHKDIIDKDAMPEILGYHVRVKKHNKDSNKDVFTFGCGAVELTRAQITTFMNIRKTLEKFSLSDLELYEEILKEAEEQYDKDDLLNLPAKEIQKLLNNTIL
jgi:hypothetical protein